VKNRPYFSKRKEIAMTRLLKRRDFLKGLGLGVGAVALGGSSWAYAQTGKEMIIGKPSPAHPIYELARYFAREKILKPEMGIALKEKMFRGFVPSFAALVKGEVNYSYQTLPSFSRAIKEKFPVKGFLDYAQQYVFYMVAPANIKTMDDLVARIKQGAKSGKKIKIASHSPSSQAHIAINTILREKGVDLKMDVEIVFLKGTPKRVAALKAKSVDATVIFASRAIESAMRGDLNILAKMPDFAPKQSLNTWVATEETLNKRSKEVQLFTNTMVRSYREMYKRDLDELADFAVMQKPWRKFKPVRAVRETIKAAREMELWPVNGGITKESITTAQKFLVETKFMKPENVLPIDQLVTTKFRDQALKELGPA
jgi:ABC-type nitrate/sulfonate/bicarbonate transport system substrate-binding protein